MKIKILLFGDRDSCSTLQVHLRDEEIQIVGAGDDENKVIDEISRTGADMVLFSDYSPTAVRVCHQIYLLRPRTISVIMADVEEAEHIKSMMQSGVRSIVSPDIEPINLITELKGIYSDEANRIMTLENTVTTSNKSKVVTVFGPKDGVGKTTLAVNLAIALAALGNKVAILDLDMQFGDVGALLGVNAKGTIVDLLEEQSNPSADIIRQFLSLHVSGISYLAPPRSPEEGKLIAPSQIDRIVAALRVYYDYLIIDTASGFDDISVACLECASRVLLVTANEIPMLRDTKKAINILQALTDFSKVRLVLGRTVEDKLQSREAAAALGMEVWAGLPFDGRTVIGAANQGTPVISDAPKTKIAKSIYLLAARIDEEDGRKAETGFGGRGGGGGGKAAPQRPARKENRRDARREAKQEAREAKARRKERGRGSRR